MRIFRNLKHAMILLDDIDLIKYYYDMIMNKIRLFIYQ